MACAPSKIVKDYIDPSFVYVHEKRDLLQPLLRNKWPIASNRSEI